MGLFRVTEYIRFFMGGIFYKRGWMYLAGLHKGGLVVPVKMKLWLLIYLLLLQIKFCLISRKVTAVSRPGGYEVYRLASNMPESKKCKPLQDKFLPLPLSIKNEILKRGMTWKKQKQKGTTFKVQSIAVANPLYIDLIHQWSYCQSKTAARQKVLSS